MSGPRLNKGIFASQVHFYSTDVLWIMRWPYELSIQRLRVEYLASLMWGLDAYDTKSSAFEWGPKS